jgi:hypothetical protein
MIIEEVSNEKYSSIFKSNYIYDSVLFNELNKEKVDSIRYLVFKDGKIRFGLCIGIKDCKILCPFSAPFGSLISFRYHSSIRSFDEAIETLDFYAKENNFISIKFILPPMFYDESNISYLINTLYRHDYQIYNIDINFQFNLNNIDLSSYINEIEHNARKNLRIALNSDLLFEHCDNENKFFEAYDIISLNRKSKGYPLRMTFQQVLDTIQIVNHDFFIVRHNDIGIASALVYYVSDKIVQVIYWGDIPNYSELKSINYLAFKLIEYYSARDIKYLDIGPSTENGIPNYGLCDFKVSIGCESSNKFTMIKYFK